MDILDGLDGWSLPDTLRLLSLRKADHEWSDIATQLKNRFGQKEKEKFYTEKCCKERFARVLSSPHPEHFLRSKGKKYSQKDLVQAWIVFLERKLTEERKKKQQLLMVQFREKLVLFNKLFDDKCAFSNERILQLLEEARKEDSKCDPRLIEKGIAQILPKIQELDNLHSSKPDTYGCLRLVVNVPQLCEMTGCDDAGRRVSSEKEQGLSTTSSVISSKMSGQSNEEKAMTPQSVVPRTAESIPELSTVLSDQQEATAVTAANVAKSVKLSPHKAIVGQQIEKDSQKQATSTNVESITSSPSVASSVNFPSSFNADTSEKEIGACPKDNEASFQIKLEPEAVESDVMESSNYPTETSEELSQGTSASNAVTSQSLDTNATTSYAGETSVGGSAETIKLEAPEESHTEELNGKSEKQLAGKRQLRNYRKETVSNDLVNYSDRFSKNQRSAGRRSSSSALELGSFLSDKSSQESKRRTSDTVAESGIHDTDATICNNRSGAGVSLDKDSENQNQLDEEVEKMNSKRRSDRLRTSETFIEPVDPKPVVLRRKATNVTENQDEEFSATAKKKRRLGTEGSQGLPEPLQTSTKKLSEQNESSEKRSGRGDLSSSSAKKDKKGNSTEAKPPVTEAVSRRSSLRSATQTPQEVNRKETTNTDSDEERTLGDIRDKHRSPRKQANDLKSGRAKEEDTTKKRLSNDDEHAKKLAESTTSDLTTTTLKKGRASSRRSGMAAQKGEGASPKKQTSDRKHSKRRDADDGSTEKKIFLMSAWRLVSSHRHAAIFAHPVSERDAQGYSVTVKRRMDLSTLKRNVESGEVRDLAEFKRRLLLMFANAVMFNSTGHDVNIYAKEMALDTLTSLKDLEKDILYVRGGTHVTRRSAAFAAEEERRKTLNSSLSSISKVTSVKDISEDLSNNTAAINSPKTLASRRSMSKLK